MKHLNTILIPTDLSQRSRRALAYGCTLAAEDKASLIILHVTSAANAWQYLSDEPLYSDYATKMWPVDRILQEATLDLNRFLEPHMARLKQLPSVTKRVVLGVVPEQIAAAAEDCKADIVILSPNRKRGLRHWLAGGITDRVTRMSPCPVLSVTAPLPSPSWRGKLVPYFFGWPRQTVATL